MRSALVAACLGSLAACGVPPSIDDLHIDWRPVEELNASLPGEIRVYEGRDSGIPLRAWTVRVDEPDERIRTRVVVSGDSDRREAATDFASRLGARVVVNAGYFRMDLDPAEHVGLLLVDRELIHAATPSVLREDGRYYIVRAALGLFEDGRVDVAWALTRDGDLYGLDDPMENAPGQPAPPPDDGDHVPWGVVDAVGGGPALVMGGVLRITSDEEVFFGTTIPDVHPRTAAGVTASGEMVLLIVDGRQQESRGVDLHELATMMRDLGCVEALNLDGGGSSTLVVNGTVINRPIGGTAEREVMSALAVFADP